MKIPEINLRYWMGRGELAKFARAMRNYWEHVRAAFEMPLQQHDPLTAPMALVNILAWQREVERLGQEPEALFRIRVAHAYGFARDAGTIAGWEEMFAKLGYPHITQDERLANVDWDVISLKIKDGDLTNVPKLLDTVIRQYGRTCRRYQYTSYVEMPLAARSKNIEAQYSMSHVKARFNVGMLPSVLNVDCEYYQATVKG
ncbi:hemolysin [Vibrio alginolyticus]|uniref:phage tail protein n=1 Tax=Vibrio TaxID=662 RepID=UPI00081A38B7|nr:MULTISPECIES: phage tail protein [Vibrio]ANZ09624.1 Hemolysins-related protein containing CBS domains [Vibrio parahaemolyticus]EGQ9095965.1 hemolysin [Vibrio alginolyticus]EHC9866522.1 hemolysin [Vibrio alginolyticus]EHZ2725167.1 hemolysin [Vibrio parahaemolyticus]EIO9264213.1 hemolysin [Vibrio alginolyticus]